MVDEPRKLTTDFSRALKVWPDLGEALNCGRSTAYDLVRTGAIRSFRCNRAVRIIPAAVREFIDAGGSDAI